MDKKFSLILVVVVAVLIGVFILTGGKSNNDNPSTQADLTAIAQNDHVKEAKNSGVILIEYADYACPGCAALFPSDRKSVV